jgi:hypothetical protein
MKDFSGIYTPAVGISSICPKPDQAGNHASVRNGLDITSGQKGTKGEIDEVTLVNVTGANISPSEAANKILHPAGRPNADFADKL